MKPTFYSVKTTFEFKVLLRHVIPGTIYAKGICWKEHTTAGGEMIATQVNRLQDS